MCYFVILNFNKLILNARIVIGNVLVDFISLETLLQNKVFPIASDKCNTGVTHNHGDSHKITNVM